LLKVNTDASRSLVKTLSVPSVPYLALYKNGKKVFSNIGLMEGHELEGVLSGYLGE